jgi:hypothetical protein
MTRRAISDISQRSKMAALPAIATPSRHGNLCLKPTPLAAMDVCFYARIGIAPWKVRMETFSSLLGGKPNFLL